MFAPLAYILELIYHYVTIVTMGEYHGATLIHEDDDILDMAYAMACDVGTIVGATCSLY